MNTITGEISASRPVASMANPMHAAKKNKLPEDWVAETDENGDEYYRNTTTGETTWDRPGFKAHRSVESTLINGHERSDTYIPDGWERKITEEGEKYYVQPSGESQWDKPPKQDVLSNSSPSHQRDQTVIPSGWDRQFTDDGDKYYVRPDGSSQWEKP